MASDWGQCIDAAYWCSDSTSALLDTGLVATWFWNGLRHPEPTPPAYCPQHNYYFPFVGRGQPETFSFWDNMYADNQGGLTFQIWAKEVLQVPTATEWHEDFGPSYDSTQYQIERLDPSCCPDVVVLDGALRLTSAATGGQGRLATRAAYDVTSFDASFRIKIEGAADGMVFWWYPTLDFPYLGGHGGYQLSWAWSDVTGCGLKFNEWGGNTVALVYHGVGNEAASCMVPSLNDGNWHQVDMTYRLGATTVAIDGMPRLSATLPVEFETGHFVFSASTGGYRANHWIDDITITCDQPLPVELTSFDASSGRWHRYRV